MLLPIRTDSPLRSTPYMNWLLIAANVLVFAWQSAHPMHVRGIDSFTRRYGLSPSGSNIELYQFLTYAFLHANLPHLLGNMLFLYIFGNNVNDKMGHMGYLAFYLGGAIAAGICYVLTQAGYAPVIGASGAVSAISGAYLVLFPRSNITIVYFFFLIGLFELQSMWFILIFFAQDLILNFGGESGVAHMAHIGGTLFGVLVCVALLVPQLLPRDQFDIVALVQRWNKRRQYRDLVARGYNPFDHTTTQPVPGRPNPLQQRIGELRGDISAALARHDSPAAARAFLQLMEIDPNQVLSRQAQLDVANQLFHDGMHAPAATAYEQLLTAYPSTDRPEQIQLVLGIIYSRYLRQADKARQCLSRAVERLGTGRELDMAREELHQLDLHRPA